MPDRCVRIRLESVTHGFNLALEFGSMLNSKPAPETDSRNIQTGSDWGTNDNLP